MLFFNCIRQRLIFPSHSLTVNFTAKSILFSVVIFRLLLLLFFFSTRTFLQISSFHEHVIICRAISVRFLFGKALFRNNVDFYTTGRWCRFLATSQNTTRLYIRRTAVQYAPVCVGKQRDT